MPPEPGGRLCCRNPRCIQTPCCCSSSRGKAWIRRGKHGQQQQARRFPRKSGTLAHPDTVPRRRRSMLEGVRVRVAILSRSSCLFSPPLASRTPSFQQKAQEANLLRLANLATSPVHRSRQFPGRTQVADDSESSNFPPTPKHSSAHQLPKPSPEACLETKSL
jgi:hypothetical protein